MLKQAADIRQSKPARERQRLLLVSDESRARRGPGDIRDACTTARCPDRIAPGTPGSSRTRTRRGRARQADVVRERPARRAERYAAVGGIEGGVAEPDQLRAEETLTSLGGPMSFADATAHPARLSTPSAPGPVLQPTTCAQNESRRRTPRQCRALGRTSRGGQLADINEIERQWRAWRRRVRIEREVDAYLSIVSERHMLLLGIDSQVLIAPAHAAPGQQMDVVPDAANTARPPGAARSIWRCCSSVHVARRRRAKSPRGGSARLLSAGERRAVGRVHGERRPDHTTASRLPSRDAVPAERSHRRGPGPREKSARA